MNKKTLIFGLGNTILSDDGAGIYIVHMLQDKLGIPQPNERRAGADEHGDDKSRITNHESQVTIKEASLGGFNFIDMLTGFDRAVIIDAIHTKSGTAGEFYELDPKALKPSVRLSSLHGIDFATACEMAKQMQIPFPAEIRIFVVEVEDEFTFGESCTEKVKAALPKACGFIYDELKKDGWFD